MKVGVSDALNAICPYFTMFPLVYPQSVISEYYIEDTAIFNPFCGRGTSLYAARKNNIFSIGVDSSPVAICAAKAKLINTTPKKIIRVARGILNSSIKLEVPKGEFWELAFSEGTLHDICMIRSSLMNKCSTPERKALRAIMMGALHGPLSKNGSSYFSNQCPRTYAPKPNYSVKFWKARSMLPPQIDTLKIIATRAHRYFSGNDTVGRGFVLRGDSRNRSTFTRISTRLKKEHQNVGLIITSPPYYGMRTYIPDQWLRNWFAGGPATVDYSAMTQISHNGIDTFAKELEKVWRRCANLAIPNAILAIRFGAINDRAINPEMIIRKSLEKVPWTILSVTATGTPPPKSRQANSFMKGNQPKEQIEEIDIIAKLSV